MRGESVRGRGSGRRSQSRRWGSRTRRRTRWARGGAVGRAMMRFGFAFLRLAFTDCEFKFGFEICGLRFDGDFRSNFNGARLKGKSRRPLQIQTLRSSHRPTVSAESRSLSASRARQSAAGKKNRGTSFGMTRLSFSSPTMKRGPNAKLRFSEIRNSHERHCIPTTLTGSRSLLGLGALAYAFGQVGDGAAYEFQVALAVICKFGGEFARGGGSHLLQGFLGGFGDAVGLFAETRLR